MKGKSKKKWVLPRHKVVRKLVYNFLIPYVKRKYNVKVDKFENQGDRPYLILLNHQSAYDQFLVAAAFSGPVYFVATEDIFSLGFVSKLIRYLVAPIPIKKQVTDISAVLNCKKVAKEGGTVAVMPEGNRTYSGVTLNMNPAIAGLVKLLKLPIAFFRIEGGFGVHPRWSDCIRKGTQMHAYVSKVIEVEDYINLDNDTLNKIISEELFVDEASIVGEYPHKKSAEYLERLIYVCPKCGLSEFESHLDQLECKNCHLTVKYLPNKKLQAINGDINFEYLKDWCDYQDDFINALDLDSFGDQPIVSDAKIGLFKVVLYKNKRKITSKASIKAFKSGLKLQYKNKVLDFKYDDILLTVLGKNKLNVYSGGKVYQIKGDKRFNAVKYVNLYYRYKNVKGGNADDRFLGF